MAPPAASDASTDPDASTDSSSDEEEEKEVAAPAAARKEEEEDESSSEESESDSSDSDSEPNSKPAPALSSPKPTKKPTTEPDKKKRRLSPSPSVDVPRALPKVKVNGARVVTATPSKKQLSEVQGNGAPVVTVMRDDAFASQYPYLAEEVDDIERMHPCGKTLKRALTSMDEDSAAALDEKIRQQKVREIEKQILRRELTNKVVQKLVELVKKN